LIGVGNIGAPIARQLLQAGHMLVVHDIRREAANALLAAGAVWSSSPTALAAPNWTRRRDQALAPQRSRNNVRWPWQEPAPLATVQRRLNNA
jgi:nucleoside-diphosphate-sugar epimerase